MEEERKGREMRPGRQNLREEPRVTETLRHSRGRERERRKRRKGDKNPSWKTQKKREGCSQLSGAVAVSQNLEFPISYSNVNRYFFLFISLVPKVRQSTRSTAGLFAHRRPHKPSSI